MKFIKDFFRKRKRKKVENQIATLLKRGTQLQRNGKLREYAQLMKEVEELELYFTADDKPKTNNVVNKVNKVEASDFIDYDGMGNYGRFPTTKNGRYK